MAALWIHGAAIYPRQGVLSLGFPDVHLKGSSRNSWLNVRTASQDTCPPVNTNDQVHGSSVTRTMSHPTHHKTTTILCIPLLPLNTDQYVSSLVLILHDRFVFFIKQGELGQINLADTNLDKILESKTSKLLYENMLKCT